MTTNTAPPSVDALLETAAAGALSAEAIDETLLIGPPPTQSAADRLAAKLKTEEIERCPSCEVTLGLPAPRVGEPTETWRCFACGAIVLSGPVEVAPPEDVAEQALHELQVPLQRLPMGRPENLKRLVQRLTASDVAGPEHRRHPRITVSLPAVGIPLSETRRAEGTTVRVTTRDISLSGMSLFADREVASPLLLIDFTSAGFRGWQVPIQVCRRQQTGFLHEIGGTFLEG